MSKPTIREILTNFDITDAKHEALAERVEAVLRLHVEDGLAVGETGCRECMTPWPCPTVEALEGRS